MPEWVKLAIPGALSFIMLGMGLTLKIEDFTRVVRYPKAAAGGLIGQMLLLPLLAFALVSVLDLEPVLAIGVMLIALSPGGAVSNLFTLLARGDIALSVTLTAISSMLTVFTVPYLLNLALQFFLDEGKLIHLPFLPTMLQIAFITIIPVSIGMAIRAKFPGLVDRAQMVVKYLSAAFLLFAVVLIMIREGQAFFDKLLMVGLLTTGLNILTMIAGYGIGLILGLRRKEVITLAVEIGIQNAILATAIAATPSLLDSTAFAIVPTIYGFTMMLVTPAAIWLLNRIHAEVGPEAPAMAGED